MKKIIDKVKVEFEDNRLTFCIAMCYLCKNSKKIMDFLLDNMSSEVIEVINSKQAVENIPGKNGYEFKVCLDFNSDPSFSSSFYNISLSKDDMEYNYSFNLSYFHNKMYYNDNLCIFNKVKKIYDNNGNVLTTLSVGPMSMIFSVSTHGNLTGYVGVATTEYDFKKSKVYISKMDIDDLMSGIRPLFEDRKYYQMLDKETMKVLFPEIYKESKIYNNELLAQYRNERYESDDLWYDANHNLIDEDEFNMLMNVSGRNGEELYERLCENKFIYKFDSNIPFISYDEWLNNKDKVGKIVINMDSIPVYSYDNNIINETYNIYNPNRLRYEDEEEEEIKNIKK